MTSEPETARRLLQVVAGAEPLLRAMSPADSGHRSAPDRWSAREVVGHLIDSASHNHQRFVRAAWQDDLVFAGYAQDDWVELQRYQECAWPDLITLWAAFNRHVAHVMEAVPGPVRSRVHARHNLEEISFRPPARGAPASLEYLMADYVDHLEHHLRQVLGTNWSDGQGPA